MAHWGTCPLDFQLFNFSGHFRAAQTLTFDPCGCLSSKNYSLSFVPPRTKSWRLCTAKTPGPYGQGIPFLFLLLSTPSVPRCGPNKSRGCIPAADWHVSASDGLWLASSDTTPSILTYCGKLSADLLELLGLYRKLVKT